MRVKQAIYLFIVLSLVYVVVQVPAGAVRVQMRSHGIFLEGGK